MKLVYLCVLLTMVGSTIDKKSLKRSLLNKGTWLRHKRLCIYFNLQVFFHTKFEISLSSHLTPTELHHILSINF